MTCGMYLPERVGETRAFVYDLGRNISGHKKTSVDRGRAWEHDIKIESRQVSGRAVLELKACS